MKVLFYLLTGLSLATVIGCQNKATSDGNPSILAVSSMASDRDFQGYWYQGKAELASYDLEQARYGEIHQGSAVLIFVTEDFSEKKQVKLDDPEKAGDDRVPVLKLNLTKKFNTGIYPYSMMLSVFTPVNVNEHPHTLKTTMSSQEWCGHAFTQLNLDGGNYRVTGLSYFESEGDENFSVKKHILEDELWTRIRLSPENLPVGEHTLIPGSFYSRLRHTDIQPRKAILSLKDNGEIRDYSIIYPEENRELIIHFEKNFPYKITGWEETFTSGWGAEAKTLTTRAVIKKTMITDYWTKHNNEHRALRTELGLSPE
ncbi:MAG: hypothetical protein SF052_00680 [Bacteroidia bacterium]|nr:hypothetical protein [Bacteroidia bacterium]